jgi:hemolysin III
MDFLTFREPVSAWTHLVWMILAIPGTVLLWKRSRGRNRRLSMLIFGLSLILCFAGSTLFHAVHDVDHIRFFHTLDQCGIFILIAGSYTPAAVTVLRGAWRWSVLCTVWVFALVGVCLRLSSDTIPNFVTTTLYLAMGWMSVLCLFELMQKLPRRSLVPLVSGGVLYSVGAIINLADFPVFAPGVFGAHELFHCFVMAGSLAHFSFMLHYVAPYRRPESRRIAPIGQLEPSPVQS